MASIKPLHDCVVLELVEAEEKTASGIVLPGSAAEKPDMGVVVAVGSGKLLDNGSVQALTVKVKDKVIFAKYKGQEIKLEGKQLLVISESDILGIVS